MTQIASGFNSGLPFSCAQGRYGELIIAQGNDLQPKRWTGVGLCTNAGIEAPATAPGITKSSVVRYYVARADVTKPGACYNTAPPVTFSTPANPPPNFRPAKAAAHLSQSSVGEIIVSDGGKHYPEAPTITLGATHGTGATFTAVLDGTPPAQDGLNHWEIVEGPPFMDETELVAADRSMFPAWRPITINVPGTGTVADTFTIIGWDCEAKIPIPVPVNLAYTVTGAGSGTGCQLRIGFYGASFWTATTDPCLVMFTLAWGVSGVTVLNPGSGFSESSVVRVTINSSAPNKRLVLEGCTPGNARNTTSPRFKVSSIAVTNQGSGYTVAPEIRIKSTSGFGAYAESTVTGGKVTGIDLEAGGGGYRTAPSVTAVSGGAEAFAVARPHLRGKYQCYYRYVDATPESSGGPIPSNLSPVTEIDTGDGTQRITWQFSAPSQEDDRELHVELWRTTSNQATTLYRVASLSDLTNDSGEDPGYSDDLTDEELRNPSRDGYAAMPIVLPNGELNAMRFTPPPKDKAVVVRFQDRMWYAVDTSGTEPNSIYFSEVDEPESVPDVNELVLQQNSRDGDSITALVPYGSSLLIMQNRRCYSLSYARKPLIDANVTPIAYRGCMGQRCWDMLGGVCYVMDRYGVYSITPDGNIADLSEPIADVFRSKIDFVKTVWNFLTIDPKTKILRAFVALTEDSSANYPTCALCFSTEAKTWWIERYPRRITASAPVKLTSGDYRSLYMVRPQTSSTGGCCVLDEGACDLAYGSIEKVTVTSAGAGYRTPPDVTVNGVPGARLQAVLDGRGGIGGIWILSGGYDSSGATITIGPPNDPSCTAPVQATASCAITSTIQPSLIAYRHRTGNFEYPTDNQKAGDVDTPRSIALTYKPQPSPCEISMRLYYNNATHPRGNAVARNRGVGFRATVPDGAERLDMGKLTVACGYDNGVARAVFSGKTLDDVRGADRHVSVELSGARRTTDPVVLYQLDVYGTAGAK